MDAGHNIYELTPEEIESLKEPDPDPILREDAARLDGYLKGRADADALARGTPIKTRAPKKSVEHEKLVWDSRKGPYRKADHAS